MLQIKHTKDAAHVRKEVGCIDVVNGARLLNGRMTEKRVFYMTPMQVATELWLVVRTERCSEFRTMYVTE